MITVQPSSVGRIVVGVDGSASSFDALRWATRVGSALGLEIDAVTAWGYPTGYGMAGANMDYRPDTDAKLILDTALDTVFGDSRPPGLRLMTREGNAARVLLDAGSGAEMLVVGSRGHGGFVGLLLGSVSAACAEHSHCPVVVIPANHP